MTITERQVLKPGTNLLLDGRKCTILGVMGAGTSCIAYKAQMKLTIEGKTASRTIVLKELYPAHQNIIRETDNSLIIPENYKALFEEESESFVKAAILQFEFHNEEDLTNFTSDIEVVYELNNTLYSVTGIVSGKSYDKINPENITSILKVGESLSHAISYYHERDYLNLDIKPSNIFYENLPGDNVAIKLFDFNTVCTKEEASQGKFSYSEGYAAPEVKAAKKGGGKLSEIGEQADIYSIGAVIFEKIMGRIPKVADQRAGKRWKLETNPYLKDVVPQLQNGITDLFRKTLAIDKKDRYSSAKELISVLEDLIKLASIKVFLKNHRISPCTPKDIYISRKNVLSEIANRLDETHILYLHALGGSGKSETAREYAEVYADKYDFIQSVFYSESLKKTIANLDFVGLKDEDRFAHSDEDIDRLYNYKYGRLGNATVYGTNTLLIIDNYDNKADPTSEEYQQNYKIIRELKNLNILILFTTRVKPDDDTECLDLENMSEEELQALFFRINPKDKNDPDRIEQVKEIIEVSYKHTMTVKLVAMQSAKYLKPLSEYLDILKTSGLNSGIKGRVTNEKDDESVTMSTVYDHIKALFDFDDLNDKQKYIMVNACLLPLSGLEANTFSEYIDLEHFDGTSGSDCLDESIEDLVNSGWIEYADTSENRFTAETKITLHPLICDIVTNELKPELTEDKCRKFYISFLDLIQEWGNNKFSNNNVYLALEKNVLYLFPKLNDVFNYQPVCDVINSIFLDTPDSDEMDITRIVNYSFITYYKNYKEEIEGQLSNCFSIEKEYVISSDVKTVNDNTFDNCCFLKKIYIDSQKLDDFYINFDNCPIEEFIVLNSPYYSVYDGVLYNKNKTELIRCPALKEKIDILYGVKNIHSSLTFRNCNNLIDLKLPDTIENIPCAAFAGLRNLKSVSLPEGIYTIEPFTFFGCLSLETVVLPNTIYEIKWNAFKNCVSLKNIVFPDNLNIIKTGAFANCLSLSNIELPQELENIGAGAFANCTKLENIILPNTLNIDDFAFINCRNLKNINLNYSMNLEYSAFFGCISLEKCLDIPIVFQNNAVIWHFDDGMALIGITDKNISFFNVQEGISFIAHFCFEDCTNLEHINLPDTLDTIGESCFKNCTSLKEIILPENVIHIGSNAFEGCKQLEKIKLSKNLEELKDNLFANCTTLTKIVIPDNVKEIGNSVFANCRSLSNISLPEKLETIHMGVFENCYSISDINFISNGMSEIPDGMFICCKSLMHIVLPDSIAKIGVQSFGGCSSIKTVQFNENIKKIMDGAFALCDSLTAITLPESLEYVGSIAFMNCHSLKFVTILNPYTNIDQGAFGYFVNESNILEPFYKVSDDGIMENYYNNRENDDYFAELIMRDKNLTIQGYKGSTAEQYAQENGFKFVPLD